MIPTKKRIAAHSIVIKDEKILLLHRINHGEEYYAFPGGGQEKDESLEQTVVRETNEETSIVIKPIRKIYHIKWDTGTEHHFYLCQYVSGTPALRTDSEEYRKMQTDDDIFIPVWVDIAQIKNLTLYQLEIRDLLLNDYVNGFKRDVQNLFIKFTERRQG